MAVKHGTRYRYSKGCRCEDCSEAERLYQRNYRLRGGGPQVVADITESYNNSGPGSVESGVAAEIDGATLKARPGLAQAALALARVLDNPKAMSQHPAAAKVLAGLLDKLCSASARGRRGSLAVVRTMSKNGGG